MRVGLKEKREIKDQEVKQMAEKKNCCVVDVSHCEFGQLIQIIPSVDQMRPSNCLLVLVPCSKLNRT